MTNLQRRLKKLEAGLTDPSGLVPHTQKWLEYWDRQMYLRMTDQLPPGQGVGSIEAVRAVMQYTDDPRSLVASIARNEEDRAGEVSA